MNAIWAVIKEAATSKKFIMALAASISGAALKIGLDLPSETVALVIGPMIAYIIGQGWADRGVTAARVAAIAEVNTEVSPAKQVEAIKSA